MVPHACLEKVDGRTWKKTQHEISAHRLQRGSLCNYGQLLISKSISVWNGLAQEIAEAKLWFYLSLN